MAATFTDRPDIVFGAGGIGGSGAQWFTHTWSTLEQVSSLLEVLSEYKLNILDSAAAYPPGNPLETNRLLGLSKAASKGFTIDTKIFSSGGRDGSLTRSNIEVSVEKDLELLGVDKVRCLYAHAPDYVTPLEETAAAFDEQYRNGRCEMLGVSNFPEDMLREYLEICDRHGYEKPSIFQGQYNALFRFPESEVLQICRSHNVKYYAYSPLAGGFLTGKTTKAREKESSADGGTPQSLQRTRWSKESPMRVYVDLFDQPAVHTAMRKFMNLCADQTPPLNPGDVSLRWLAYHSALGHGDGIIVGASKISQIEDSVKAISAGPLSDELRQVVEDLWIEGKQGIDIGKNFGVKPKK